MKGSTFKRTLPSGTVTWCFNVDAGRDPNGKRKRIFKGGFTREKDAEAELARLLQELNEGTFVHRDPRTLAEFMKQWLAEYAEKKVSPKTLERYRSLAAHVTGEIGAIPLAKLTTLQLQRTYNGLMDRKKDNGQPAFSVKTIHHVHGLTHVALKTAIKWGLLRINPSDGCDLPPVPQREAKALDYDVTAQLMASCSNSWLHEMLLLYTASGARRGELMALQWPAVDFEMGIVTIARSLEQTQPRPLTAEEQERLTPVERRMRAQGLRLKETKGRRIRRVKLPDGVLDILRGIQARQEENRSLYGPDYCSDLDLVFCHPDGFFIRPDTVTKAARRLAKQAGLTGVSLHTLRHSHGSQLLSAGVPLPAVSRRLGHSNVHTTATIYAHSLPSDEIAAADLWSAAMKKAESGKKSAKVLPMRPKTKSA
jgi:integrase